MTRSRRFILLAAVAIVVVGLVLAYAALPSLVRHVAIARIQALTGRPAVIDSVRLHLLRGGADVQGLRIAERDGTPFADVERLDLRVRLAPLLLGRIHLRELVLRAPTVRVVRLAAAEFNFSDLIRSSGKPGKPLDVTVDRFAIEGGTVTLEDRALPEARTWRSERIVVEAHNVSTRRDDGTAVGTSVTAGAPVSLRMEQLRLYPVHLRAQIAVDGLDLSVAQVYLPPTVPLIIERGRATTRVDVALDAREGLRVDATTRVEDLALARRGSPGTGAVAPRMTVTVAGLTSRDGAFGVRQLDATATATLLDPRVAPGGRVDFPDIQAHLVDVTWPVSIPARIDVRSGPSRAGTFSIAGALRPAPAPSELRLKAAGLDLAPWAVLLPVSARVRGIAEADLAVDEPLAAQVPARIRGAVSVRRPAVMDGSRTLLAAEQISATSLELRWPARVTVGRLLIDRPHALVERDRAGQFPLVSLTQRPVPTAASSPAAGGAKMGTPAGSPGNAPAAGAVVPGVEIGAIVLRDGTVDWRDDAVAPAARLRLSGVQATVTGVAWPLHGPASVRLALRTPGDGDVRVEGRVGMDPFRAEGRVTARGVALAPYRPYVAIPARIEGRADLDVQATLPPPSEGRMTARGTAGVSRLDVQDGERTVLRVGRGAATGLEIEWPIRVVVDHLTLSQPWILLERDERGQLPLRALLSPRRAPVTPAAATPEPSTEPAGEPLAVKVARVTIENGGARVVDRAVSPAFAADIESLGLRGQGFSTTPAPPARLDLSARLTSGADLTLRGTVGPLVGPVRLDLNGELRRFEIPRANTYVTHYVGWRVREGSLATTLRVRLEGDAVDARTQIRLSRLAIARARDTDQAQARIGLPLGMIVGLMKDRRGEITIEFPVGGRLSDPRFDFSDAIWKAVRHVAVKAVTLPVSWIGRVHVSRDSRIEDVEVDPVRFEPGSDALTPDGQTQLTRVAAFLEQLPDMRLTVKPVVTSRDLGVLKQRAVDAAIQDTAKASGLSPEAAAARLHGERLGKAPVPMSPEAIREALVEKEPAPTSQITELATQRLQRLRAQTKRLGVDADRLPALEPEVRTEAAFTGIELGLVAPTDGVKPPGLVDRLRGLGRSVTGEGSARE